MTPVSLRFGLIVVGDELLDGDRDDRHFAWFKALLRPRGLQLGWYSVLPDDEAILTAQLRCAIAQGGPAFVCGGIGGTPDDKTRACAAAAADVALTRHPEAAGLIAGRFGTEAYPERIAMADLPAGCELIPNPVNQIPGFSLRNLFFLPGFPQMAWPMAEWVLKHRFPGTAAALRERAVRVEGVPESRLVPLMNRLTRAFPEHKIFSLPHLGDDRHILLGVRGRDGLEAAFAALQDELEREGLGWTWPADSAGAAS